MTTVAGFFDTAVDASAAMDELAKIGIPRDHISVFSHEGAHRAIGSHDVVDIDEDRGDRAAKGAMMGGLAGLVVGLAAVVIPGVGPLLLLGPLATAVVSAGVGATAGGLLGGLTKLGISEYEAQFYVEGMRRGGTLLLVKLAEGNEERVQQVFRDNGVVDMGERIKHYHNTGYVHYDAGAPSYTPEQIVAERELLRKAAAARDPEAMVSPGTR